MGEKDRHFEAEEIIEDPADSASADEARADLPGGGSDKSLDPWRASRARRRELERMQKDLDEG